MHIKIVGFKSHIDSTYNLEKDSLTLLKGVSGAGKSTILQAIYWCLYGNMRNIYNNAGISKTCSVTLFFQNFTIYRQKRPELFKVTLNDEKTYEDAVAQELINRTFGNKDLWKACSYIEQKQRCALLSGSAAERTELLNKLSFFNDDPKEFISKISLKLKEINSLFLQEQAVFTSELNTFTKEIESKPVTTKILSIDEINIRKNKIPVLQKEISSLYIKVKDHERASGSYNTILNQISQIQNNIDSLTSEYNSLLVSNNSDDNKESIRSSKEIKYNNRLNKLKSAEQELTQILKTLSQREILDNELISLNSLFQSQSNINTGDILDNIEPEYIWKINNIENRREHNIKLSEQLQIPYNKEDIHAEINRLQDVLLKLKNIEKHKQTYNSLLQYQQQLNTVIENIPRDTMITDEQIIIIEKQLSEMKVNMYDLKKGLEILTCPGCSKPLKYTNEGLVAAERDPVSREQINTIEREYNIIGNYLIKIKEGLNIKKRIIHLQDNLEGVNIQELISNNNDNSSYISSRIRTLSSIEILDPPPRSSKTLRLHYDISILKTKIQNIQNEISSLPSISSEYCNMSTIEINSKLSDVRNTIADMVSKHTSILSLQKQIEMLKSSLKSYKENRDKLVLNLNPEASNLYSNKQKELTLLQEEIVDAEYALVMTERQKELLNKREKVMLLSKDLVALQRLKHNALEVECKQLETTIYNINSSLEDILPSFFPDEPISCQISLYKKLKSKKDVKRNFNISIKYKGAEYDNINSLSGGEGDRISLAIILALNSVSNSSILLLDECISSLDPVLKEACLNAIKSVNKTILCVDHSGVEGFYDKVISLH